MNENEKSSGVLLNCIDCHGQFVFTNGEKQYYLENFLAEPKRCPSCRRLRKLNKEATKHETRGY